MRRPVAAIAAASILFAAAPSFAQDASSQAAAQALFEQARSLMTEGKYAEACPKLAESQRLDPGAGTLLNLGHCYEKNGRTASAWVTFKDAAAAADLKHRDDWSHNARERAQALAPTLSKLTIDVPVDARADGLQVRRDGVNVGSAEWGVPIPVDPGEHAIEAIAPGKTRWSQTVRVGPNADQQKISVPPLQAEPVTPVAPVPAPEPSTSTPVSNPASTSVSTSTSESHAGSTQRTVGLVLGGVGVVGVAIGSIFGLSAMSKNSDAKSLCPDTTCTSAAGVQANDDAKSAATLSTIGFVAGGALLAGGAVLFFTAPKKEQTAIRVSPTLVAHGAGLGVGGAW